MEYYHSETDDEDDGSWIEISSSSGESSSSDDDLSYDISIGDEHEHEHEQHGCVCGVVGPYDDTIPTANEDLRITRSCQFQFDLQQLHHKPIYCDPPSPRRNLWLAAALCFLVLPLLAVSKFAMRPSTIINFGDDHETIYVPGVGFSGFWFSLGRLKSIPDPSSKHYVCFSAGCLGSVAVLNGFSVDEMACMAQSSQEAWKQGVISRYEVVSNFVDGLVYRNFPIGPGGDLLNCLDRLQLTDTDTDTNSTSSSNSTTTTTNLSNVPQLLSKLHILTTTPSMSMAMRSPTNLDALREMLIQTAWIPLATGNGLFHDGHNDGGFSLLQHPKCTQSVTLPLDAKLMLNSLNVNMGIDEAYRLWNQGLAYGL